MCHVEVFKGTGHFPFFGCLGGCEGKGKEITGMGRLRPGRSISGSALHMWHGISRRSDKKRKPFYFTLLLLHVQCN